MLLNNSIVDRHGKVIGFRCFQCDLVKQRMWGNICNECRERERLVNVVNVRESRDAELDEIRNTSERR